MSVYEILDQNTAGSQWELECVCFVGIWEKMIRQKVNIYLGKIRQKCLHFDLET